MKITVEISDDLYRQAKSEAALRGRKLKDLVEEGLRLVLETPRPTSKRRSLAGLVREARGVIDSGMIDLASNALSALQSQMKRSWAGEVRTRCE
jgi:hypothetical protein